ncbi:MAG: hypothetical protein GY761_13095 [Hyphomicrobiales bacterium]|nr:hypothetical protein [Hyphomicrobiales bacterium]
MNDQNRSGQPGSLGDHGGSADNGSSDATANPFTGLEKGSLDWIEANGAKTVSDVVTMARNSEKLTGGIHLPGRDAPSEDVSSFFDKTMGHFMPEDTSGYDFIMPENIPENMPYDVEMVDLFKTGMHARGVPPQLANKVHDWYVNDVLVPGFEQELDVLQGAADNSSAMLKKHWGEPGSSQFQTQMEYTMKAVNGLGGNYKQALINAGAIDDENNILQSDLIMPLAKIGEMHFTEDGMVTGQYNEPNPFANDSQNWSKANEIINNDPVKAKSLILSAGKDPADYRL